MKNRLKEFISHIDSNIEILEIKNSDIIFEQRVKLKCFQCENYYKKWTCSSNIPVLDYENIIKNEYSNALIFYLVTPVDEETFQSVRTRSTNILHKSLLASEKYLYDNNYSLATSFIGGSCKLCKNGCHPEKCANPLLARIPMEAAGINVIKTMKNLKIDVKFPITNELSRYGLLLWED